MASGATTAKAFIAQVHAAARASRGSTPTIQGIECSRFWLQGLIVSITTDGTRCMLDDGTGIVAVDLRTFLKSIPVVMTTPLTAGDLVMVIGPMVRRSSATTLSPLSLSDPESELAMLAHQVVTITNQPQQDSIWFLEVIEYWRTARSWQQTIE